MLPLPLAYALPAPFAIVLLCLTAWHLLPFLQLLPSLAALSSLSFIPKPRRNLPREFFNLPPRSDTSSTSLVATSVLGIRAKVVLLLTIHASISLLAGWIYLIIGSNSMGRLEWVLVGLSITPIPAVMATLTLFSTGAKPNLVFGPGGVTHETVFRRILPMSAWPPVLAIALAAAVPSGAGYALVALNGALIASLLGMSSLTLLHRGRSREGHIRISSPLPSTEKTSRPSSPLPEEEALREMQEGDSWVTSPCKPLCLNHPNLEADLSPRINNQPIAVLLRHVRDIPDTPLEYTIRQTIQLFPKFMAILTHEHAIHPSILDILPLHSLSTSDSNHQIPSTRPNAQIVHRNDHDALHGRRDHLSQQHTRLGTPISRRQHHRRLLA